MSEHHKLLASTFMAAVGLCITLDTWRILRLPKQPGRRAGKPSAR